MLEERSRKVVEVPEKEVPNVRKENSSWSEASSRKLVCLGLWFSGRDDAFARVKLVSGKRNVELLGITEVYV